MLNTQCVQYPLVATAEPLNYYIPTTRMLTGLEVDVWDLSSIDTASEATFHYFGTKCPFQWWVDVNPNNALVARGAEILHSMRGRMRYFDHIDILIIRFSHEECGVMRSCHVQGSVWSDALGSCESTLEYVAMVSIDIGEEAPFSNSD